MNFARQRLRLILPGLILLSFAAVLLAHAYVGIWNRWVADDYCSAASYRAYGFFGSQKYWYTIWTGRISATFAGAVAHAIGPKLMPVMPALIIAAWLAALTWAIRAWATPAGWTWPVTTSLFFAELILAATISRAPSIFQSIYWMSGTLTYTPPLILLSLLAGILGRELAPANASRHARRLALCGAIGFVAGGFNEMYLAFQSAGLCLAVALCAGLIRDDRGRGVRSLLLAGLLGSILVGIIMLSSPGNGVRLGESAMKSQGPPPCDVLSWLTAALRFAVSLAAHAITSSRPTMAAVVFFPAMVALHFHGEPPASGARSMLKWLVLLPLLALVLMACYYAPVGYLAAYVRGGYSPQARTETAPQFIFYCFAAAWAYLAGLVLRRVPALNNPGVSLASALMAILLLAMPLYSVRRALALKPIMSQYAATWDIFDGQARAAGLRGDTGFVAPRFPATGRDANGYLYFNVRLIGPDPTNWVNECVARYYGMECITAQ